MPVLVCLVRGTSVNFRLLDYEAAVLILSFPRSGALIAGTWAVMQYMGDELRDIPPR